jgi:hypothetical protein
LENWKIVCIFAPRNKWKKLEMPLDELKQHTTFKGLNPLAERSVLVALQRRYKVIKGS